jgi:hypothetical protein
VRPPAELGPAASNAGFFKSREQQIIFINPPDTLLRCWSWFAQPLQGPVAGGLDDQLRCQIDPVSKNTLFVNSSDRRRYEHFHTFDRVNMHHLDDAWLNGGNTTYRRRPVCHQLVYVPGELSLS